MKLKIEHPWNLSPREAKILQEELSEKVSLKPTFNSFEEIESIAGCDVSFNDQRVIAAGVIMSLAGLQLIDRVIIIREEEIPPPYIPGYLSFREGPILVQLLQEFKLQPDVILFDGQGIAHPRRMGIAAHMGILFDVATIGCAKNLLYGEYENPLLERGRRSPLKDSTTSEIVGMVVRTRDSVKPVFVSPGHKIDMGLSVEVVLKCTPKYRLPEPLRLAHRLSQIHHSSQNFA
ncbi:TPA: endonuclease V [bacterium]|nr:endonuclease V [bacterium]